MLTSQKNQDVSSHFIQMDIHGHFHNLKQETQHKMLVEIRSPPPLPPPPSVPQKNLILKKS